MIIRNLYTESGANACLTGPHNTVYQTQGNKKTACTKFPFLFTWKSALARGPTAFLQGPIVNLPEESERLNPLRRPAANSL